MLYTKLNKKLDALQKSRNKSTPKQDDQNYAPFPRTVNLTRITFTEEEQKLLDLGLQFSILKSPPSTSPLKRKEPSNSSMTNYRIQSGLWQLRR
jgi:hypothetical protein